MEIINRNLFVSMANRLQIIDLDNIVHSVMQNIHVDLESVWKIVQLNDYLITAGSTINFINFSDPTNPIIIDTIDVADRFFLDIEVAKETLIAKGTTGEVFFYDIADFSNITEITNLDAGKGLSIEVKQDLLYYIRDEGGFDVYNISNLSNITKVKEYSDFGSLRYTMRVDNYIYGKNEFTGINIINITSLHNIKRINIPTRNIYKANVQFKDNYAFFASGQSGLEVYNIKHPHRPKFVWQEQNPGFATDIAIQNNHAYLANGYDGLYVYDINQNEKPVNVVKHALAGFTSNVAIKGNILVTSQGEEGISIFNISTPGNPQLITEYTNETINVQRTLIGENKLYLATLEDGLVIINSSNLASLEYYSTLSSNESVTSFTFMDNHLVYASESGIYFYDITENNALSYCGNWSTQELVSDILIYNDNLVISYLKENTVLLEFNNFSSFEIIAETYESRTLRIAIHNELLYTANGNSGANVYSFDNNQNNIADYCEPFILRGSILSVLGIILIATLIVILVKRKRSNI